MFRFTLIYLLVTGFLFGCGSKSTVVLLPNPDGTVGKIEVSSEAGTQQLTEANQATNVSTSNKKPTVPEMLSDSDIKNSFSEVLAIQPMLPAEFILYFKFDSNDLTSESENLLPEIITTIKTRNSTDIIISGHTDRLGAKEYNIQLSLKRAKNIRSKLISMGVTPEYIEFTSHGEGNPIIKTPDNVAEPKNRRVEVTIR